ncbi:MAG: aldehyde dehydrogenase family protein [Pirellulales bacterium]
MFASSVQRELLIAKLKSLLSDAPAKYIHRAGLETAKLCVEQAIASGATWVVGDRTHLQSHEACRPIVLGNVTESMEIARTDMFAPVLSIMAVDDMDEALSNSSLCRYALGASVFASAQQAMQIARTIDAGCVTIDDIVVPTADPRVSFGGRRDSGYGMTRGLEGLREMTRLKVIQKVTWKMAAPSDDPTRTTAAAHERIDSHSSRPRLESEIAGTSAIVDRRAHEEDIAENETLTQRHLRFYRN